MREETNRSASRLRAVAAPICLDPPVRSPLLLMAVLMTGCPPVDNSGGTAPEGDPLAFQRVTESLGVSCAAVEDTAVLLDDLADVDIFLADCVAGDVTIHEAASALDTAVSASYDGEREFVVVSASGGCLSTLDLFQVRLDETSTSPVLRPWLLRGDESFEADATCASPDAQQIFLARAADASGATSIDLAIGTYNPTLPGAPQPDQYP